MSHVKFCAPFMACTRVQRADRSDGYVHARLIPRHKRQSGVHLIRFRRYSFFRHSLVSGGNRQGRPGDRICILIIFICICYLKSILHTTLFLVESHGSVCHCTKRRSPGVENGTINDIIFQRRRARATLGSRTLSSRSQSSIFHAGII